MPRTLNAAGIRAWHYEQMINDMALGVKSYAEIAEEYGYADQSIRAFAMRNKADIEAKKRDQSSEYSHIWCTKKGDALRVLSLQLKDCLHQKALLEEHAARETETIRNVDPDASEVLPNGPEYRAYIKLIKDLERELMDQTGQLYQRITVDSAQAKSGITDFDTVYLDESGNLMAVVQQPEQ